MAGPGRRTGSRSPRDALELSLANSVWLRDSEGLVVGDEFLAACGERLGAQAYRAAFDQSTVDDVNAWVSDRTHGMIPEMLSQIPAGAQLFLINALAFEGAWEEPYDEEGSIEPDVFTTEEGIEQDVRMMRSREQAQDAVGVVRDVVHEQDVVHVRRAVVEREQDELVHLRPVCRARTVVLRRLSILLCHTLSPMLRPFFGASRPSN